MRYFKDLLLDPSFMGALLGAIITGLIAMSVFYLQKRNSDNKEHEHYKKIFAGLQKNLNLANNSSRIFKSMVVSNEFEHDTMNVCNASFIGVSELLEEIEVKDIPYKIYFDFFEIKDALTTIKLCSGIYIETKSLAFLREDLFDNVERFNRSLEKLEKYYGK